MLLKLAQKETMMKDKETKKYDPDEKFGGTKDEDTLLRAIEFAKTVKQTKKE